MRHVSPFAPKEEATVMRHCLLLTALLSVIVQLNGCAAFRDYDQEMQQTTDQLMMGNVDGALYLIEWNNPWESKDLLYYFEKGAVLSVGNLLPESQMAWRSADQMIVQREDAVSSAPMKFLGQLGRELGVMYVNDKLQRYNGYDYEKVMLTTQMALNQLSVDDFEGARTDIKKTHEREALIARERERQYEEVEEQAKAQGIKVQYKDLRGYPVTLLDAPSVIELKNGYQSAFSHYLAGFTYEALGERDLAAPGYRQAIELRPNVPFLEQALRELDKPPAKADESDVLIVVQSGLAPARASVKVLIPVQLNENLVIEAPISFPVMVPDTVTPFFDSIKVDARKRPLSLINSVTDMATRTLRDDMPDIIGSARFRANLDAIAQADYNSQNPTKASLVVTRKDPLEEADTRTWRTLPDKTLVARLRLKKGNHTINVPNSTGTLTVRIDRDHQVINLRAFGDRLFIIGTAYVASTEPAPGLK